MKPVVKESSWVALINQANICFEKTFGRLPTIEEKSKISLWVRRENKKRRLGKIKLNEFFRGGLNEK